MSASPDPATTRPPAAGATASPYVRRKRAIAACQFCRLRKTKCDNVRPVCGSCRHHQARCVYADGSEGDGLQVGLDEAASRHREVLERLDDIRSLLARSSPPDARGGTAFETGSALSTSAANGFDRDGASLGAVEIESQSGRQPSSSPSAYLQYTKCESILKWPVLENVMADDDAAIESFIFDTYVRGDGEKDEPVPIPYKNSASPASCASAGLKSKTSAVPDRDAPEPTYVMLCQKFLALVNCRNPILDAQDLLSYARSVTEDGLRWDGKSCVVVSPTPSFPSDQNVTRAQPFASTIPTKIFLSFLLAPWLATRALGRHLPLCNPLHRRQRAGTRLFLPMSCHIRTTKPP